MSELFSSHPPAELLRALLLLLTGFIAASTLSSLTTRVVCKKTSKHYGKIIGRVVFYLIVVIFIIMALRELGFSLSVLLGAAGIFTVAIGFAAQTAVSNIISGIFLLFDHTFEIGDVIRIDDVTGEVISIDLISIKLRTFDNLYVRIPNENVMKASVVTLTHFPIRRLDVQLGVAYKENIEHVKKTLENVAKYNVLAMDYPEPLFIFQGFGDSALNIQFSLWTARENFITLKTTIHEEIKLAFDAENIEIPFPHLSIYSGSVTEPMPVTLIRDKPSAHDTSPK